MSKKLLLGIIVVLLITNIATLTFMDRSDAIVINEEDGEGTKVSNKEPVATIAGEKIKYADWVTALRENHGEQQLEAMIDRHIVSNLAAEKDIEVHEKVIERELAYLTSMQGAMTEEEFLVEEEKWREEIVYRYQLELLLTEGVDVPADEVQSYYDSYKNQYDFTPAMQFSHILVQNMDTAEKVYSELEEGASFDLLAREYSLDDETKQVGGYLGFINTNSQFFPNGYEEVAADMDEHSYSEPFAADAGIAIIYLHQKLPGIEFSFEEIAPYVKSELALHNNKITLDAKALWDNVDIDWIYSK